MSEELPDTGFTLPLQGYLLHHFGAIHNHRQVEHSFRRAPDRAVGVLSGEGASTAPVLPRWVGAVTTAGDGYKVLPTLREWQPKPPELARFPIAVSG